MTTTTRGNWEEQLARSRALRAEELARREAEHAERRARSRAVWASVPLPVVPLFQDLRTLAIAGPTPPRRMPKWRFVVASDLALQLQPKDSRRCLFEGIALTGDRITRESFDVRDLTVASLKFWIEAAPDGAWTFHPRAFWTGSPSLVHDSPAWKQRALTALDPALYAELDSLRLITDACLCCGKALIDPVSQARRIGPECAQKPDIAAWLRKRWARVVGNAAVASTSERRLIHGDSQTSRSEHGSCADQAEAKAETPAESSRRAQPAAAPAEALRPTVTAIPPGTVLRRLEDVVVVPTPVTIHEGHQERIEQQLRATLFRATAMRAQPWVTLVSNNAYGEPWTEIVRLSSVEVGPYAQYERALTLAWRSPPKQRSVYRRFIPWEMSWCVLAWGQHVVSLEDLPPSETPCRWHSVTFGPCYHLVVKRFYAVAGQEIWIDNSDVVVADQRRQQSGHGES
jgi:hypothetical protein